MLATITCFPNATIRLSVDSLRVTAVNFYMMDRMIDGSGFDLLLLGQILQASALCAVLSEWPNELPSHAAVLSFDYVLIEYSYVHGLGI